MRRVFDGWLDILILIFLMAMCATLSFTAIDKIVGLHASIGKDKAVTAADHLQYEDVPYTVSDILLSCIRLDALCPADTITVSYGSNSLVIDCNAESVLVDPYLTAGEIMKLKPVGMDNAVWYALPIRTTLTYNSVKETHDYSVEIGG